MKIEQHALTLPGQALVNYSVYRLLRRLVWTQTLRISLLHAFLHVSECQSRAQNVSVK